MLYMYLAFTLWVRGYFACLFIVCLSFFKITFQKILSRIPSVSNSLYPDQVQYFVRPYLQGPDCLQKLSPDDTSRQRAHAFSEAVVCLCAKQNFEDIFLVHPWEILEMTNT